MCCIEWLDRSLGCECFSPSRPRSSCSGPRRTAIRCPRNRYVSTQIDRLQVSTEQNRLLYKFSTGQNRCSKKETLVGFDCVGTYIPVPSFCCLPIKVCFNLLTLKLITYMYTNIFHLNGHFLNSMMPIIRQRGWPLVSARMCT
jgi:hypothetical protein